MRILIPAAAKALRESEDGLTLQELGAVIGTRWPDRVVRGMQRDGYVVGEENGRLSIVVDVDEGRGEDQATLSPGLIERPAAVVNAGTLFPVEHEPRSPYDPMSEAA